MDLIELRRLRRWRRAALWSGSACATVALGATAALVQQPGATALPAPTRTATTAPDEAATGLPLPLVLAAQASGEVSPGRPTRLSVRITNPSDEAVLVRRLSGAVTGVQTRRPPLPDRPRCDPAWYVVGDLALTTRLGAGGTVDVGLPVELVDLPGVDQDDCQGATYSFSLSATGSEA